MKKNIINDNFDEEMRDSFDVNANPLKKQPTIPIMQIDKDNKRKKNVSSRNVFLGTIG